MNLWYNKLFCYYFYDDIIFYRVKGNSEERSCGKLWGDFCEFCVIKCSYLGCVCPCWAFSVSFLYLKAAVPSRQPQTSPQSSGSLSLLPMEICTNFPWPSPPNQIKNIESSESVRMNWFWNRATQLQVSLLGAGISWPGNSVCFLFKSFGSLTGVYLFCFVLFFKCVFFLSAACLCFAKLRLL